MKLISANEHQVLTEMIGVQYTETLETIEKRLMGIRNELKKYNAIKAAGYQIRAKAKHIEQNEKRSNYFLSLQKRNANIKNIVRLKLEVNREIIDKTEILEELSSFYKTLYQGKEYNDDYENIFLTNSVPQIKISNQLLCDDSVKLEECSTAIRKMKSNKSPGTDCLTAESYQYFWENIKHLVFDSIIYAIENKKNFHVNRDGVCSG